MNHLLPKVFKNRSTRVLLLLFVALLLLIAYFLLHSYYVQLNIHKQKVLSNLSGITNTLSTQIKGDQLEYLFEKYSEIDQIKSNEDDSIYSQLQALLAEVKEKNKLQSEVYTLSLNDTGSGFFFGVSSAEKPFYRHVYEHFPKEILSLYETGGSVGVYEDENGHWLSALTPILNSKGEVIAVIQADKLFDSFIAEARSSILINLLISVVFMGVLVFFLVRSVRSILMTEDQLTRDLIESKQVLEEKNRDIMDSIQYAKKIQDAILPQRAKIQKELPESFVFFRPRDIVSGDFYWFKQIGDFIVIASVDCTGHGVPGAFMSMIGSVLLEDIFSNNKTTQPCKVLDQLHEKVVGALKQDAQGADSKDGMDIAMCIINQSTNQLAYAGACRPLIFIRDGEINRIKADSAPIGGLLSDRSNYHVHEIDLQKGDIFYIFSDGYPDQFGGANNKKYMTMRFRKFLHSISNEPMKIQEELLEKEFNQWKGEEEQVDDVLVIGFKW